MWHTLETKRMLFRSRATCFMFMSEARRPAQIPVDQAIKTTFLTDSGVLLLFGFVHFINCATTLL